MLRNISVRRKALLVLLVPASTAVIVLGILFFIGRALDRAVHWTLHSQEVLSTVESVESQLVAIHGENLQLALLGTSESAFQLGERAEALSQALARLPMLLDDNLHQLAAAARYIPLAQSLLTDLANTHAALRSGKVGEGAANSAANDRRLMEVSKLAAGIRKEERRLAVARLAEAGHISQQRRTALVVGGVAIVLVVLLLGWRLMRSMIWRLLVIRENVQRVAGDQELTAPVAARDEIGQIDHAVHDMVRALRAQRRDNEMFVYSVSHDLRSPLVNLQGFGKELERSSRELGDLATAGDLDAAARRRVQQIVGEEMPEALHYIDLAVQRQARIIDSLLSLSRAGRVDYRWGAVDLHACVKDLVAQAVIGEPQPQVEFVIGELPAIHGDRDAIERVFDNLIGNAVKYLDPSRPGRIEIGCSQRSPDSVVVFVRDNGIGIAAANLERVFVPFARFAGGPGEGIGLSLVRRVVDRHHGSIWIESTLGQGTTVFVRLLPARDGGAVAP